MQSINIITVGDIFGAKGIHNCKNFFRRILNPILFSHRKGQKRNGRYTYTLLCKTPHVLCYWLLHIFFLKHFCLHFSISCTYFIIIRKYPFTTMKNYLFWTAVLQCPALLQHSKKDFKTHLRSIYIDSIYRFQIYLNIQYNIYI